MKFKVNSLIMVFFIITLWHQFIYSQQDIKKDDEKAFHFGKHSFQFRISDNFRLTDFSGSLLSYKYHFGDNLALRVGAEWYSYDRSETEDWYIYSSDTTYFLLDIEGVDSNLDLAMQLLYYFSPQNEIKLYGGIGPLITYRTGKDEITDVEFSENRDRFSYNALYDQQSYSIGLSSGYGLEWFFRKNMSLMAEYNFQVYYYETTLTRRRITLRREEDDSIDLRENDGNGWQFESRGVKFGLSVYF